MATSVSPFWPYPRIVAHRLCGTLAPENTLAALKKAASIGVKAVETDVMLTRDGVAVISHDPVLGRAVASDAAVADLTLTDLRELDAGIRFGAEWRGEKVPLLTEVIDFALSHGIFLNLEIKPSSDDLADATARETVRIVRERFSGVAQPLISSFSRAALKAAQTAAPDIPRGLLLEGQVSDWVTTALTLQVRTVHPDASMNAAFAAEAHAHGWGVMAWTIDDPAEAQKLLGYGADALCTNRPDRLLRLGR